MPIGRNAHSGSPLTASGHTSSASGLRLGSELGSLQRLFAVDAMARVLGDLLTDARGHPALDLLVMAEEAPGIIRRVVWRSGWALQAPSPLRAIVVWFARAGRNSPFADVGWARTQRIGGWSSGRLSHYVGSR